MKYLYLHYIVRQFPGKNFPSKIIRENGIPGEKPYYMQAGVQQSSYYMLIRPSAAHCILYHLPLYHWDFYTVSTKLLRMLAITLSE